MFTMLFALAAAASAGCVWYASSRNLVRFPGLFKGKSLRAPVADHPDNQATASRWLIYSDALRRVRRLAQRTVRNYQRIGPAIDETRLALDNTERATTISNDRREAAREEPHPLISSQRARKALTVGLLLGDLAVTSSVIQRIERDTTPLNAYVIAMAVAVTLFVVGKFIAGSFAEMLSARSQAQAGFVVGIAAALFLIVGLYRLREGRASGAAALISAPILGSMCLTLVSHNKLHSDAQTSERHAKSAQKKLARRSNRLGRLSGKAEAALTGLAATTAQLGLTRERSIQSASGTSLGGANGGANTVVTDVVSTLAFHHLIDVVDVASIEAIRRDVMQFRSDCEAVLNSLIKPELRQVLGKPRALPNSRSTWASPVPTNGDGITDNAADNVEESNESSAAGNVEGNPADEAPVEANPPAGSDNTIQLNGAGPELVGTFHSGESS